MSEDEYVATTKGRKFTPEEDEELRRLVEDEKLTNWVTIASRMKRRNVHQCRERWRMIGHTKGKRSEWSKSEDEILLSKCNEIGHHWCQIQKFVPNHTLSQVKARLKYLLKQSNSAYVPPKGIRRSSKSYQTVMKTRHSAASEAPEHPVYEMESPPETSYSELMKDQEKQIEIEPQENLQSNDYSSFFSEFQDPNDSVGFTFLGADNEGIDNFMGF